VSGPAIRAQAVERRFGEREVLRGIDLEPPAGVFLLVTGRNGAG
jgi:sulfonate transport system ATP-binding protein